MYTRKFRNLLILTLTTTFGMVLAFALPWLMNTQGAAAQSSQVLNASESGSVSSEAAAVFSLKETTLQEATAVFTTYFVSKTGDGTAPTLGWSTAYTNVQDALGSAISGEHIWIATGVYTPGLNASDTFQLKSNVEIYGGFLGTETLLTQRDWRENPTVLSGDIFGDDTTTPVGVVTDTTNITGPNNYNVVTGSGVANSAVLDGFYITAGTADYPSYLYGGGMVNRGGSPSLSNVIFIGNKAAIGGGGMDNSRSYPRLTNVEFSYNSAYRGGGMNNIESSPIMTNTVFISNSAETEGGGLYNYLSRPEMSGVLFRGNEAEKGGGLYNYGNSIAKLINVEFTGNSADYGGGMHNNSSPVLKNVQFSGNKANIEGGGMYNTGSFVLDTELTNVLFSGNSAGVGGGMYNFSADLLVKNSIFWNNSDGTGTGTLEANIYNNTNKMYFRYSLMQGSGGSDSWTTNPSYVDQGNNLDSDPRFFLDVDPSTAPTTQGNLRLQDGSPAINAGNNSYVSDLPTDLDGKPRIMDGTVDMGTFESIFYYKFLPVIFR